MIKVNELRIGNYIYHCGFDENETAEVTGIIVLGKDKYNLVIDAHSQDGKTRTASRVQMEAVAPIPITPEWLERCGFEKEKYADVKETGKWDVKEKWVSQDKELELFYVVLAGKEMVGDNACFARKMKGFHRYRPIKSVHLLQNIYFFLTGEELNVKL